MTTHNEDAKSEAQRTDEAWLRLQSKLAGESIHPQWMTWPSSADETQVIQGSAEQPLSNVDQHAVAGGMTQADLEQQRASAVTATRPRMKRRKLQGRGKWAALAAACVVFGAVMTTPVGDRALAAILNQFRMQDVAVVNGDDLRNMFNSFNDGKNVAENINQFGTFKSESGSIQGEFTSEEAERRLHYKLVPGLVEAGGTVYVAPSSTLTLNIDLDEMNLAMKRMGAKRLLPESVDGKPITLTLPETVQYDLRSDDGLYASLSQQNVPVVTVDSSIDVKEALDAVLDFPMLPSSLKESLRTSRMLSGEIPMPVITDHRTETTTLDVEGTKVILQMYREDGGRNRTIYTANWVKDGQLFNFYGGEKFTTQEAVTKQIGAWIHS